MKLPSLSLMFIRLVILLLFFAEQPSGKTLIGLDPPFGLDPAQREGTRAVGPITAVWFAVFIMLHQSHFATPTSPFRTMLHHGVQSPPFRRHMFVRVLRSTHFAQVILALLTCPM